MGLVMRAVRIAMDGREVSRSELAYRRAIRRRLAMYACVEECHECGRIARGTYVLGGLRLCHSCYMVWSAGA